MLAHDGVSAIPQAGRAQHVRENRAALGLELDAEDRVPLDRAFPPPDVPKALEMFEAAAGGRFTRRSQDEASGPPRRSARAP